MKKKIVFVNQSSGYLMIDIVNAFKNEYEERVLIAGSVTLRDVQLDKEVKVHIGIKYSRLSTLKRLFTWFLFFIKVLYLIKTKYRKDELFLVSNPPFNFFLPLFCRNKFRLLVYDVYPDVLVHSGNFNQKSPFINWWRKINQKVFKRAERIYTIGNGMKAVLANSVEFKKIEVIPIWSNNKFLKPILKNENKFLQEHKLLDKFIVMYSGNIGRTHNMDFLIKLAEKTVDETIFYLIIAGGERFIQLEEQVIKSGLRNILILPLQPIESLPFTLSASDIALITLGAEASSLSVPSKTFSFLSVGSPLLCIVDPEAELNNVVNKYKIGFCCQSHEVEKMINFINRVHKDKKYHIELKQNALTASSKFTNTNAFKFI